MADEVGTVPRGSKYAGDQGPQFWIFSIFIIKKSNFNGKVVYLGDNIMRANWFKIISGEMHVQDYKTFPFQKGLILLKLNGLNVAG